MIGWHHDGNIILARYALLVPLSICLNHRVRNEKFHSLAMVTLSLVTIWYLRFFSLVGLFDGGNEMYTSALVSYPKLDHQDAEYFKVPNPSDAWWYLLLPVRTPLDTLDHIKDPNHTAFEPHILYRRLECISIIPLPESPLLHALDAPRNWILVLIRPCKSEPSKVDCFPQYQTYVSREIVDLRAIQCAVGKVENCGYFLYSWS